MGITPQIAAQSLVNLVNSLVKSHSPPASPGCIQLLNVVDLALQAARLPHLLVKALIDVEIATGSQTGLLIAKHCQDEKWSRSYPIDIQEYGPLFKDGPMLHLGLLGAIQQSSWPRAELERLRSAVSLDQDFTFLVRTLAEDFNTITREISAMVSRLVNIKDLRSRCAMHVVQIEAYLAAVEVEGSLADLNCLDLGSGNGELVNHLQKDGARACGTELNFKGPGLFGIAEESQFDVVFATGFMEPGAFSWPHVGINVMTYNDRADELVAIAARLLKPRGLLVVRNVSYPLPFSHRALMEASLVHQRVLLPFCGPSFGGRMALWRKL